MRSLIANAVGGIAIFLITLPGINRLPELIRYLDGMLFPVVTNVTVEQMFPLAMGNDLFLHVYGNKVRDCAYLGTFTYVHTPIGSLEVENQYDNDVSPGSTRPKGAQDLSVLHLFMKDIVYTQSVEIVVQHRCGWLWDTYTTLGTFAVK